MDLIGGLKIAGVLGIILIFSYGVKWTYNKHLEAIDAAINQAKLEAAIAEQTAVREATTQLKLEQELERVVLQEELDRARANADNFRRMLTIDHDLDRLLQRKPGLILPRVNEGTEEVLKELEELTR